MYPYQFRRYQDNLHPTDQFLYHDQARTERQADWQDRIAHVACLTRHPGQMPESPCHQELTSQDQSNGFQGPLQQRYAHPVHTYFQSRGQTEPVWQVDLPDIVLPTYCLRDSTPPYYWRIPLRWHL